MTEPPITRDEHRAEAQRLSEFYHRRRDAGAMSHLERMEILAEATLHAMLGQEGTG